MGSLHDSLPRASPTRPGGKTPIHQGRQRWLEDHQVGVEVLDEQWAVTFLRHRDRARRGDAATCRELLGYLRERGRVPPVSSDRRIIGPLERIERAYERFLVSERGLTSATVDNYLPTVRAFLRERFADEQVELGQLVPQDANRFILRHAQRVSQSRAKLMVTALRSFLGFLHQCGDIAVDFAGAVLPIMHWRLTALPKSLPPEQVESLLESCERSTIAGWRDYAILLLMARLGLRAGEVVAMVLEDLDWEAGVVTVRGKGQRQEALPLPHEVGQALVRCLK